MVWELESRRENGPAPLAEAAVDRGGEDTAIAVDVAWRIYIEASARATHTPWGGMDVLVMNNAGTTAGARPALRPTRPTGDRASLQAI